MEKSIDKNDPGRILFYHPESDSYIEEIIPYFDNSVDESKWWEERTELDQVNGVSHHEERFLDQKYANQLKKKIASLERENLKLKALGGDANSRVLMNEELTNLLPPEYRSKYPMYQFFRECGPLEGFAVLQSQLMINNCNLKVWGVFLFKDEAEMAVDWLKNNRAEGGFTYEVKPTRITRFQGF